MNLKHGRDISNEACTLKILKYHFVHLEVSLILLMELTATIFRNITNLFIQYYVDLIHLSHQI